MIVNRVTAPAQIPVSLAECKRDLRILDSDEDSYITELIAEAVDYVDGYQGLLGHALITQSWAFTMPCFMDKVRLPFAPMISLSSIQYYDGDNASQSLSTDFYTLVGGSNNAFLEAVDGTPLPGTWDRDDAVTLTLSAGYGPNPSDVPASIRRAIRLLVSHWFEQPAPTVSGSINTVPNSFDDLIAVHRRGFVG